jgi:YVTN family beta-propeller protein
MDVHLLGPVEVLVDGRPVELGTTKQRALLAMLALDAGRTVSADHLAAGLWGEDVPPSAHKMVQQYVSQLRRLLNGDTGEIVTRGRGYELRLGGGATDVARCQDLLDGDRVRPHEALRLWRGPALADVAEEPFAGAEIRRLEDLRLRAVELAIDEDLRAGRHRELLADIDELVAEHPLSERLHGQRMLALYRSGRQAEALEAYRAARRVLVDEIGIEPGPELRALHERILRQDPALRLPTVAEPESQPEPETDQRTRRPRMLVAAASVAVVAGIALFALTRIGDEDGLPRIGEDGVGRIDADGTIEARYAVGRAPGAVVAGGGSVWVASERDRTVTRIDRAHGRVVTISLGAEPVGMAYGGGSLWVADGIGRRVVRVDPDVDRVVQEIELANVPRAIAAGYGSVWVASAVSGAIIRIDLERGRVQPPLRIGGSPTAIATGAGSVWVASESEGRVTRVDPRSGAAVRTVGVGGAPAAIAVGGAGVWVADRDGDTVSRIEPARGIVTDIVHVRRAPVAVAADDDAVWVANSEDGTLSRIDPARRRVTRTVHVGGGPAGLAFAQGSLWAAAAGDVAGHRGGTLRVGGTEPVTSWDLDPASPESFDQLGFALLSVLYDGLVAYRRVGGAGGSQLVADLAESLPQPTDDGRTYAFRLRPGLRYADGRAVRASDFRASLERVMPTNEAVLGAFANVQGANACGARRCDLSAGIQTDDATRTIVIRLRRPDPELLHQLALPSAALLPGGGARERGALPPPGTGPYRAASFDPRGGGRLVRNPRFRSWSSDARPQAFADEIRFGPYREGEADVHLGGFVPQSPSRLRELATHYGGRLRVEPTLMTEWLFLNTRTPPFDDPRVRRAVNYATDRQRVVELVGGDEAAAITCRILPPGMPGHRPLCPFTRDATPAGGWRAPDLDRARRLIRASGTRGARVRLWAAADFGPIGPYFRDLLRDLGYRSSLRFFPASQGDRYFERLIREPPQAGIVAYVGDVLDPSTFIRPNFMCDFDPANFARLCDRRLDALTDRAAEAHDPGTADVLWDRVERRLSALAPVVPLFHGRALAILSERTGNFQNHPLWGPLLDQLWVS